MNQPPDLAVLLRGKTTYLREFQQVLERAGLKSWTGPMPGTT